MSVDSLSRRRFLRGMALLVPTVGGGLVLTSCGGSSAPAGAGANANETVNGAYMTALGFSSSFIETMVAKEQGFFDEVGLNLEIQGGQGTATAVQAILAGSADLTRANAINSTIAIANEGVPIVNIATVRQKSQFEVVSLASAPITDPAQLTGKTCGIVSAGGATENLLDLMLINSGVDPGSVARPVTGVGGSAFELVKAGEIDAWISVDVDRSTIERSEPGTLTHFNTDDYTSIASDSYNTTLEMVESDSDLPVRFLAGVLRAIRWASDEANWPAAIENLRVYNNEVDPESALLEMPLLIESWNAAGPENALQLDADVWKGGQEELLAAGLLTKTVPVEQLIYPDYLEQARAR